jgi:hypothetical protein
MNEVRIFAIAMHEFLMAVSCLLVYREFQNVGGF